MREIVERIDRLMAPMLTAEQAAELHGVLVFVKQASACRTGRCLPKGWSPPNRLVPVEVANV